MELLTGCGKFEVVVDHTMHTNGTTKHHISLLIQQKQLIFFCSRRIWTREDRALLWISQEYKTIIVIVETICPDGWCFAMNVIYFSNYYPFLLSLVLTSGLTTFFWTAAKVGAMYLWNKTGIAMKSLSSIDFGLTWVDWRVRSCTVMYCQCQLYYSWRL